MLQANLPATREDRLSLISKFFKEYSENKNWVALELTLDRSSWADCSSNDELLYAVLPMQAEIATADLELRLYPFLPYQIRTISKEDGVRAYQRDPHMLLIADRLVDIYHQTTAKIPESPVALAEWIEFHLRKLYESGKKGTPNLVFNRLVPLGEGLVGVEALLRIYPGNVLMEIDRERGDTEPSRNRNCFSIVMSPFYPPAFGRYSPDVSIVLTRESDFTQVEASDRVRIRRASNLVLAEHGIPITDLGQDKQSLGVWVESEKE